MISPTVLPVVPARLEQSMEQALRIIRPNFHLEWNLFLAFLPLALALILFLPRSKPLHGWLWWPLTGIFLLFLPNAPYVLTDVIHFVDRVRVTPSLPFWAVSLLMVEFFVYFLLGAQCFTLSVMLLGGFLKRRRMGWQVPPVEFLLLALSAFGIYLGRFDGLNSWNIVTDPEKVIDHALRDAIHQSPQETITMLFSVVFFIFYLNKTLNIFIYRILKRSYS